MTRSRIVWAASLLVVAGAVWAGSQAVERYLDYQAEAIFRGLGMADWQPLSAGHETPQEIRPPWLVLRSESSDTLGLAVRALKVQQGSDEETELWLIEIDSSGREHSLTAAPKRGKLSLDGGQPVITVTDVDADTVGLNSYLALNGELLPLKLVGPVDSLLEITRLNGSDPSRDDLKEVQPARP